MAEQIHIPQHVLEAVADDPSIEACGFIIRHDDDSMGEWVVAPNESPNPEYSFMFPEPDELDNVIGIWHSHPSGSLVPTDEDVHLFEMAGVRVGVVLTLVDDDAVVGATWTRPGDAWVMSSKSVYRIQTQQDATSLDQ